MADDVNFNVAKCIRDTTDFGITHIHNICTDKITDVPWGAVDWFGFVSLSALGLTFLIALAAMLIASIRMFLD